MYDIFTIADTKMPEGFLWGSGYAGHQVEGNNTNCQFYRNEMRGLYPERSGLACNSYEMWQTDVDLVEALGHKAFRTSVEWSRIQPCENSFSEEAADHYIRLFSALKEKGIKTFCTLVHFTYPIWFDDKGGFKNADNLVYFEKYLEYIVPKLAPYVDFWNVLNEFNLEKDPEIKINSVKYHALGYHTIKKYSKAPISTAHAFVMYMPYRPNNPMDIAQAKMQDTNNNEFFFHAMRTGEITQCYHGGEYCPDVKGTVDFWATNIYTRTLVDARKSSGSGITRYAHKALNLIPKKFYLGEFYPECFIANLTRLTDKPVYITENGTSCDDDRFRIVSLILHLNAIREAMDMGVDVRGYLHWSLLDNYEWGSYLPRFGLSSVDRESFARTPKPSAHFFKDVIENNGVNQEIIRKYLKELPSLAELK